MVAHFRMRMFLKNQTLHTEDHCKKLYKEIKLQYVALAPISKYSTKVCTPRLATQNERCLYIPGGNNGSTYLTNKRKLLQGMRITCKEGASFKDSTTTTS